MENHITKAPWLGGSKTRFLRVAPGVGKNCPGAFRDALGLFEAKHKTPLVPGPGPASCTFFLVMAWLGLSGQKSTARRNHAHRNRLQNLH